jgi:hypothetical protein
MRAAAILGSAVVLAMADRALAVDPKPLENAYWKFEEGADGTPVNDTNINAVIDSANANHMRTYIANTAPSYSSIVSTPIVPQTGLPNALSLQFTGLKDIYTDGKNINYPTVSSVFTLEASFKLDNVGGGAYQCIVGKDGKPSGGPIATLELKVRGDTGVLQLEQIDGSSATRQVSSAGALSAGQWYHAAAVNDGSTLSLYLDSGDGSGYVLQGQTAVSGAFPDMNSAWAIGRGMYNDSPSDWVNGGEIEEVRLSNTALDPSKFLFTPATSRWNVDAGGAWSSPSNWQDGIPRVAGATANLTDAIQATRTLSVDVPVTLGSLIFDNAQGYVLAGAQGITIDTVSGNGAISVFNGSHLVTVPVTLARDTTVFVNNSSDLLKLSGNLTAAAGVTIGKQGLGTLEVTNVRAFGLNVAAGSVHVTPSGGSFAAVSRIEQLAIAGGSVLDLGDNKLITPMPVGSWTGAAYDGVTGMVAAGRNGGGWGGSGGIVTSQSTAVSGNYHSIGVAQASDVRPNTASETALWAGQTITGTDTLVMYTYGGDATLDGKLNIDDYVRIDNGISASLTGWSNGDFNYDGKVNIDDYTTVIDANIGTQGAPFGVTEGIDSVSAVPEPAASALLALFITCCGRRSRRPGGQSD